MTSYDVPRFFRIVLLVAAFLASGQAAMGQGDPPQDPPLTPAEKEAEKKIRLKIGTDGLEKLYKLHPEARSGLEKAVGYAVFDITSAYAILFVGQKGKGVLYDNQAKKPVYMSSLRAGTGPGIGYQRVFQVFVFKSKGAMEQFILAGGTGGDLSASVNAGKEGSVLSFNPSIDIYQIPESGMALQASWGGTVYSVDRQLDP